jgi:hypothetical protein
LTIVEVGRPWRNTFSTPPLLIVVLTAEPPAEIFRMSPLFRIRSCWAGGAVYVVIVSSSINADTTDSASVTVDESEVTLSTAA